MSDKRLYQRLSAATLFTLGCAATAPTMNDRAVGEVKLSADGRHAAAVEAVPGGWRIVRDRRPGLVLDEVYRGTLAFSHDGAHVAVAGRSHGRAVVAIDDRVFPPCDGIADLGWTSDGHVLYLGRTGARATLFVDGRASGDYSAARDLTPAPAGGHWALIAGEGGRERIVLDGAPGDLHDAIDRFAFSRDGARLAVVARDGAVAAVWIDGAQATTELFDEVRPSSLAFDGDGIVLFAGRRGARWHVVRAAEVGPAHDSVGDPVTAAATAHWGYVARDGRTTHVFVDAREVGQHDGPASLHLAPIGSRFVWTRASEGAVEIVDEQGRIARVDLLVAGSLTFDADGKRWQCVAGFVDLRRLYVFVDGRAVRTFDDGSRVRN